MSTVKTNNVQIGQSVTATNNFTWYQPSTPDGTVRLGVGTAGVTTLDAVTVTNSGNVGIGTSTFNYAAANRGLLTIGGSASAVLGFNYGTSATGYIGAFNGYLTIGAPAGNYINWDINGEKMRLDSSGNLGLGVAPNTWIGGVKAFQQNVNCSLWSYGSGSSMQVGLMNNAYINTSGQYIRQTANPASQFYQSNGSHYWYTDASGGSQGSVWSPNQAMTLDANGNLLVGTTSAFGRLASQQTTSAVNFRAECNVTSYTSTNIWSTFTSSGNNNTTAIHFAAYTGTNVCVIYGNGNIQNTNNSYGALSDIKLKENIVDATPKLEDLCKVKIRNFSLKGEQNHKQIGVVAQELEEIFPGLVEEVADRDKEGNILGTSTKSVKYSVFTPMLIKAIQELSAELNELKQKVNA